jgi:hypothetical protein
MKKIPVSRKLNGPISCPAEGKLLAESIDFPRTTKKIVEFFRGLPRLY